MHKSYYFGGIAETLQNCDYNQEHSKFNNKTQLKKECKQNLKNGTVGHLSVTTKKIKKETSSNDETKKPKKFFCKTQSSPRWNQNHHATLAMKNVKKRKLEDDGIEDSMTSCNKTQSPKEQNMTCNHLSVKTKIVKKQKIKDDAIEKTNSRKKIKTELSNSLCEESTAIANASLTMKPSKKKKGKYPTKKTGGDRNPEKEARTIYVGNLPLSMTKKDLKTLFRCYGKVESVRLRSSVPAKAGMSKKAANILHDYNPEKNHLNGYVVMDSIKSAKDAQTMNGMVLDDHHIRVDFAEKRDYSKEFSVFVGNLPFNCQDEELYLFFNQNTEVESVRIVRDSQTGICKGFGFAILKSKDGVELALAMNEKEFKGRMLRVKRVNKQKKGGKKTKHTVVSSNGMKKTKKGKGMAFEGDRSRKGVNERKKIQRKIKYANTTSKQEKKSFNALRGDGKRTKDFKKKKNVKKMAVNRKNIKK